MPRIEITAIGSAEIIAINNITTKINGPMKMDIMTDAGIDGRVLIGAARLLEKTAGMERKIVAVVGKEVSAVLMRGQDNKERGQLVRLQFDQMGRRGQSIIAALINERGQPICGVDADIPGNNITVYVGQDIGGEIILREQS